jgi:indolepyruvate ferredoxin oxidoreductase beta subunit
MKEYNIIISGVGGQGVITIANLIGLAAFKQGIKARVGEIHGLSQRFGSVFTHVRIGEDVYSSIVPLGRGDLLISLEAIETLRYLKYMKKDGLILMNTLMTEPFKTISVDPKIADINEIKKMMKNAFDGKILIINGNELTEKLKNSLLLNTAIIGIALTIPGFPLKEESIKASIEEMFDRKYVELNIRALEVGMNYGKEILSTQ